MSNIEILILSVGLAMDACAVSICKVLSVTKVKMRYALCVGLYFGIFQGIMPMIGYFLGSRFEALISGVDHWVAFGLLSIIGLNMVKESFENPEELSSSFSPRTMLPLAVATSIDALAVGVSLAFLQVNIWVTILCIVATTFILSVAGIFVGNVFGSKYKSKAEMVGGLVLIAMGIKILFEHLGLWEDLFSLFK